MTFATRTAVAAGIFCFVCAFARFGCGGGGGFEICGSS